MRVKTFRGRPVKRMRKDGDKIRLILYHPVPGEPGETILITQADWDQFGLEEDRPAGRSSELREMAAAAQGGATAIPKAHS